MSYHNVGYVTYLDYASLVIMIILIISYYLLKHLDSIQNRMLKVMFYSHLIVIFMDIINVMGPRLELDMMKVVLYGSHLCYFIMHNITIFAFFCYCCCLVDHYGDGRPWLQFFGCVPMAVAPLNMVRRVLDYAVTEIDTSKINMGIANYGYDWPLPFVRGETEARTIGNVEAVQIAINYGADIRFDETARSPYFYYTDASRVEHVVWFEDVRSLSEKYALIPEYGLRGIGVWQVMRWFRGMWLVF